MNLLEFQDITQHRLLQSLRIRLDYLAFFLTTCLTLPALVLIIRVIRMLWEQFSCNGVSGFLAGNCHVLDRFLTAVGDLAVLVRRLLVISVFELSSAVGVVTLISVRAIFALIPVFAHDGLVFTRVGSRDAATGQLVHMRAWRVRCSLSLAPLRGFATLAHLSLHRLGRRHHGVDDLRTKF